MLKRSQRPSLAANYMPCIGRSSDFRAVAQLLPVVVWQSDPKGALTFINERWVELTGQPTSEALRRCFFVTLARSARQPSMTPSRGPRLWPMPQP